MFQQNVHLRPTVLYCHNTIATGEQKRVWLVNGWTPWSLHHDTAVLHKDHFLPHKMYKPHTRFKSIKWHVKILQEKKFFNNKAFPTLDWGGRKRDVYPACCAAKLNSWSSSSTLWKRWETLKGGRKRFHRRKKKVEFSSH